MPLTKLVIATRGSKLAIWQAEHIRDLLREKHSLNIELLVLKTRGDVILDVPLAKVGGKGLFVKEIEDALLRGEADIAVHSMKDVPMELPAGLVLGAVPQRETPDDLLLSERFGSLEELPQGARVGTSSLRRQAQLLAVRPDLTVLSLRGNVDTRLRKLKEGEFDAIIMAAAGIRRLGLSARHMIPLRPPSFLPASGQGALGIEFREDRRDLHELLAFLNHEPTRVCIAAERGFLAGLEGGCQVPIAAYAVLTEAKGQSGAGATSRPDMERIGPDALVSLEGLVADVSGNTIIRHSLQGPASEARELGLRLAGAVKAIGGDAILDALYRQDE